MSYSFTTLLQRRSIVKLYKADYKGAFPGGSNSKQSACRCRRPGFSPWAGKLLWRRKWRPTPVFLPGQCHGQRSWPATVCGQKESDTTEHAHKGIDYKTVNLSGQIFISSHCVFHLPSSAYFITKKFNIIVAKKKMSLKSRFLALKDFLMVTVYD